MAWVPTDSCIAVGDGQAVVVRVGDEVHAFRNQCIHQEASLHGGVVRNGVLSCPFHFWRYHVDTGRLVGSQKSLERFPVDVVDGQAYVLVPDLSEGLPLRDRLLERAREYDREAAYRAESRADTTSASDTSPKSS